MGQIISKVKKITLIVVSIFICELFFGYTGTMLLVKGIAIRHILFILSFFCLYGFMLLYMIQNKISVFSLKKDSILRSFRMIDWVIFLFILSTFASWLLVPRITGGSFTLAKREIMDTACMLLLYYPVRFMIEWKELNVKWLSKLIYVLAVLFSVMHIVFFVGQTVDQDFMNNLFDFYKKSVGGRAITPGVILGHGGYPRIMFGTSVYMMVGLYMVFIRMPNLKIYDHVVHLIHVFALLTTMTKSIWFGVIGGFCIYAVFYIVYQLKNKNYKAVMQIVILGVSSVLLAVILNMTLFQGLIGARLTNSFATSSNRPGQTNSDDEDESDFMQMEAQGAAISNDIKIEQTKRLLAEWKKYPVFGKGYGSYLKDYTRSKESVFSYEMQLPALLMKIGIVGIAICAAVVLAAMYTMFRASKRNYSRFFAWLFLLISFGITIQTNPLILSFTGISVILFILYTCINQYYENKQEQEAKKVVSFSQNSLAAEETK